MVEIYCMGWVDKPLFCVCQFSLTGQEVKLDWNEHMD
jgi:hypothetical protein